MCSGELGKGKGGWPPLSSTGTRIHKLGPVYVARLPELCKTVDEWVASLGDQSSPTPSKGTAAEAT